MAKQYFVMGIGGTGMRCIESLIHLCAMGMFDDTEIHLLALDTDKNNGNFSRLKEVKEAYVNTDVEVNARRVIRGDFGNGQVRKDKLGSSYSVIQSKVNEMYRQGLVH